MLFADFVSGAIIGGIAGGIAGAIAGVVLLIFRKPVMCPKCNATIPKMQFAANLKQMIDGSRTCKNCGCKVTRRGFKAKS